MNNHIEEERITAMLREGLRELPAPDGENMAVTVAAALSAQSHVSRGSISRVWRQTLKPGLIGAALSLAVTRACLPGLLHVPPIALPSVPVQAGGLTETAFADQEGLQIDLNDPHGAAFDGIEGSSSGQTGQDKAPAAASPTQPAPPIRPAAGHSTRKSDPRGYGMATAPRLAPQRES